MAPHYQDDSLTIHKYVCGPMYNNAYILVCPQTNESIVIDAPEDPGKMLEAAKETDVKSILITHGHRDHIQAFDEVTQALSAPVGIGRDDNHNLPRDADFFMEDGDEIKAGTISLKAIFTPGHTPGSTCLIIGNHLFSGDTLFPGGPGKSDSPASFKQLVESVSSRLLVLDDDFKIYPGHGDDGELKKSKEDFAVFQSKDHPDDLYGDVAWIG